MAKDGASGRCLDSERQRQHDEMLEAALARPGIREVMKVYYDWRVRDRQLDPYRSATRRPGRTITTDHANFD